jgi:ketosteroid isomerase-like protein
MQVNVRQWIFCCSVVLLCVAPVFAQTAEEEKSRAQVTALEKSWALSYKIGDAKALATLLDDNVLMVDDDGALQTKSEFLATVHAANTNDAQVSAESLAVRVYGETAVAIGVVSVKAKQNGKLVSRRERFIDTWILKNGNWVCIATDVTPITRS